MPKILTDLERGQTTLSFSRARPVASSSSNAGSRESSPGPGSDPAGSSTTRGYRRGGGGGSGRGRGRGQGPRTGGGGRGGGGAAWEAKRTAMRLVASENETLHLPILISADPELAKAIKSTVAYPCMPPTTPVTKLDGGRKTRVRFWNCDSFDAAERLVGEWGVENVAVLNMANAFTPGGGYINGATAQEEALCRRSTLYAHIANPAFYPLHEEGGLWSPGVRVFRRGDDDGGVVMDSDDAFSCGVISVAALDTPQLTPSKDHYADPQELQTTIHKIMAILRIAKLAKQKAVVLGAFGCGAFRNPPAAMATFFLRALTQDPEFSDTFSDVVFAILERSGSDNMRPWKEVWAGVAEEDQEVEEPAPRPAASTGESRVPVPDDEDVDVVLAPPTPVEETVAAEAISKKEGEEEEEGGGTEEKVSEGVASPFFVK